MKKESEIKFKELKAKIQRSATEEEINGMKDSNL